MIRLIGSRQVQHVVVSVLDSGRGLTDQQIIDINAGDLPSPGASAGTMAGMGILDPLAGTGLGLGIVREAAYEFDGTLRAWHTPGGGAALTLTYPLGSSDEARWFAPRVAPGAMSRRSEITES
jgi:K+-sensing histidine kinase KdpD